MHFQEVPGNLQDECSLIPGYHAIASDSPHLCGILACLLITA